MGRGTRFILTEHTARKRGVVARQSIAYWAQATGEGAECLHIRALSRVKLKARVRIKELREKTPGFF